MKTESKRIIYYDAVRVCQEFCVNLKNRFLPKNIILLYHRITELDLDPWSLCVTPKHFAEHLEVLERLKVAVPLTQIAQSYHNDKRSRRAVAVTFDDGYADNFYQAKPLLERFNIPATFFIPTGNLNQYHEFWWDQLENIFLRPRNLPNLLRIKIKEDEYQWELGESSRFNDNDFDRFCGWKTTENSYPTFRHYLFSEFSNLLKTLSVNEKRNVVEKLSEWAGIKTKVHIKYKTMSSNEIYDMSRSKILAIGGHTVTHPFLSTIPIAMQEDEIKKNKACLEDVIGQPITGFAYPHGDYSQDSVNIVRKSGFSFACSTIDKKVFWNADPYLLPRIKVENWNGEEFARKISRLLYREIIF